VPKVEDDRFFHPDMVHIHELVTQGDLLSVVENITGALHE
jgi:histidine ammonia-lyase